MFSLGVIAFRMLTGEYPFGSVEEIKDKKLLANKQLITCKGYSEEIADFVSDRLLSKEDRVWFDQILTDRTKVREHLSHVKGVHEVINLYLKAEELKE